MSLAGYTLQQDQTTHLTTAITTTTSTLAAPTVFSLAADQVGEGIVEIDDELIWVNEYDRISRNATVPPYGRGFMGSTAATHVAGSRVVIKPTFPRTSVKRAIQDTIRAIGSSIFAAKNTSFIYNSTIDSYAFLNLNIQNILRMSWQDIGSSQRWIPITKWLWDGSPDVATWGAGSQLLTINDGRIQTGRKVNVTYATAPAILSTTSEASFAAQTGLPESVKDVVVLGAAYRLLSFLDPARNTLTSPQADEIDSKRPYGSGNSSTRELYKLYTTRLAEETQAQQQQYPPRIRYSRQEQSMAVRKYSSRSQKTTLTTAITSSSSSITVVSAPALMGGITITAGQTYTVVIDPDTALEEIVDVYSASTNPVSGNTLAIVRNINGSIAQAHSAGAEVRHMAIGRDYQEANDHAENVTAAHGLTIANVTLSTGTGNVSTTMLAANAVTTAKITDANVTTAKIADSAITSVKIADGTITTGDIADSAIATGKIANAAVTTAKIEESAVTNSRIAGDAVTSDKIAADAVGTSEIANLAVTTAKIADSAITSAKIADGTIVAGDIADGAITSAKILDGTIATADLADGAVTSGKIADATIVNADVSATAAIAKTKLDLGGTITSADLVDGTIVAADIANGTITAAKMAVDPYARANHTGTQIASTISDFDTQVRTNRLDQMAAPTSSVSANSQKITNLGLATSNGDAVSVAYIDSQKGIANGIAPLDSNGKVPFDNIPHTAVAEVFVVASEAAMLAISNVGIGDIAIRSDLNKSFILRATPGTTLGNWNELLTPIDSVLSVDGATGAVDLTGVYLNKTTGVLAGNLNANTHKVTNLGTPTSDADAATKAYVDTVAGSATAAAASAAAAAATYDNFDDRYLGSKSSAPTLDNDGNALITGAIYWNSVTNAMYAWTGSEWGSISSTADIYRFRFTASGGETSITGTDDNGLTLAYIPGKEQVYLNGVLLARTSDYTASNGSSITSLAALAASDIVEVITFTAFELADSIARSLFDAKGDILVATSADTPGKLTVGTNGHYLKANSSTATGLEWAAVPDPDLTPYATEIMTIMGAY